MINCSFLYMLFSVGCGVEAFVKHAKAVSQEIASSTNYDFVIAGGGIAGLTVADRLTEDLNGELIAHKYILLCCSLSYNVEQCLSWLSKLDHSIRAKMAF